ncbi:hypothetical protein DHEL01_v203328 [Diaporthe helianthi]|uniref:Uncharacterized protein n=1 Tax=Diaporthe helianthi TaxID=158607 RepID=A0A2P5I6Z8_DIAHE|nr:hypothetical protein DHEL01_v203328 [Diaporthe helianthi]
MNNAREMDDKLNALRGEGRHGFRYQSYLNRTRPEQPVADSSLERRWKEEKQSFSRAPVPKLLRDKYLR